MSQQAIQKKEVTVIQCIDTERWKQEVSKALPKQIPLDVMMRVARTAAQDPRMSLANPQSFFTALLKCARAGLPPDGRLSHLICYGKEVQAIFDWKGYVAAAARNNIFATAKLVHAADEFEVLEDDGTGKTQVLHKVDMKRPRGEVVLAYSRSVTKTDHGDHIDYEFMTTEEIEDVRKNFSKAKDSLMWTKTWGEAAKKTVIRRHSKRWDIAPEVAKALNEDDDTFVPQAAQVVSRPIFGGQKPNSEDPAAIEAPPAEPAEAPKHESKGSIEDTRAALKKLGVKEQDFLEFVFNAGITPEQWRTLEALHEDNAAVLPQIFEQLPDIAKKIKAGS